MKITYDHTVDALYIHFKETTVEGEADQDGVEGHDVAELGHGGFDAVLGEVDIADEVRVFEGAGERGS